MTQSTNNFSNARDASRARRKALSQSGKSAIISARSSASQKQAASPAPAAKAMLQAGVYQAIGGTAASGKAASIARRLAMSSRGKAGVVSSDRTREDAEKLSTSRNVSPDTTKDTGTTEASDTKATCGCGCNGKKQECKTQIVNTSASAVINGVSMMKNIRRQANKMSSGRAASYARREAMSKRGKAGISSKGLTAAQTARATNPDLSSRELAMTLRDQRSRKGRCGEKKSEPCGRVRPNKNNGAAQDAPWKVGASETTHGQTLTGTMVGRSESVTGDEASTCRGITGTEYLGADIFRNFCAADATPSTARKVNVTTTSHGNAVSGDRLGRGKNVTGNEQGTCKSVTGDEYTSAEQQQGYCGEFATKSPRKVSMTETMKGKAVTGNNVGRSESVTGDEPGSNRLLTGSQYMQAAESAGTVPKKVGQSQTLRGGSVSGTLLDRTQQVTGNEAGTCRNVTGDEYLSQEQFKGFCENVPQPTDNKVEVSTTGQGNAVTGVMTSRSQLVTGNEPGTCKSVTGTPYASTEQVSAYCGIDEIKKIDASTPAKRTFAGSEISGIQPAVGGTMTGDSKGACEPVSGTPYVGVDQLAQACPSQPADVHSADYPQPLASAGATENVSAPVQSAHAPAQMLSSGVTGSSYGKGNITGPFGMADGKVTGTEQARFGNNNNAPAVAVVMPAIQPMVEGRVKPRISGEGMDAGKKITGNDWDRGDHVTGTEGASAVQRNPTFHGANARAASSVSVMKATKRNDDVPVPVSKVTGSSGNTADGSLVTYSGGARG